jgi:hypothetical protein
MFELKNLRVRYQKANRKSSTYNGLGSDVGGAGNILGNAIDCEGLLILILAAAICAILVNVIWFIFSAPILMAELALDSVVSLQVYHRIRRSDSQPY